MPEKLTRMSLTLPQSLFEELNYVVKKQAYSSRSEAVRDAIRDFLTSYKWRSELKGERIGIITLLYKHTFRGLTDSLVDIQHHYRQILTAVQHIHLDEENCLEILIVRGQGKAIKKLTDALGALRGVEQVKITTVK
ncbi:MAG: nickel-responsive regulator [Hadesarchaea archaeon YNP_N21]|jgi:CopG family nickel-responsive transcriptional regulator|nr:MAG: nickel-responsive regulator [Hadesarchaea archaeon YNP_N21]